MRQLVQDILNQFKEKQQFLADLAIAAYSELAVFFREPVAQQRKVIIGRALLETFETGGQNFRAMLDTQEWTADMVQMVREYLSHWSAREFSKLAQDVSTELRAQAEGRSMPMREKTLRELSDSRQECGLGDPNLTRSLPLLLSHFVENLLKPLEANQVGILKDDDSSVGIMYLILAKTAYTRDRYNVFKKVFDSLLSRRQPIIQFCKGQLPSITVALQGKYRV